MAKAREHWAVMLAQCRPVVYPRARGETQNPQGKFPKPVSLGGRAVGWVEEEIQSWLAERIAAGRKAAA